MSFKRFDTEDIVISSDSATAPAWSDNKVTLTSFYTSSNQVDRVSGDYYWNVHKDDPQIDSTADIQFSVAFGHVNGSGSTVYDNGLPGQNFYSPSSAIYRQTRNIALGTEEQDFTFVTNTPEHIYTISIERARYKEKLLPSSLTLELRKGTDVIRLTDNSNYTSTVTFGDAGRVYDLISGSQGIVTSTPKDSGSLGYTTNAGSYGKFLPDVGMIVLNGEALDAPGTEGGISLGTNLDGNTDGGNLLKIYDAVRLGGSFTLRSEETISSNYIFVRARNSEFNYSTNPSNTTGSGELRHNIMIDSPQSYITSVGLYNDNNELLGVAKLSRPLLKDFTKEALVRIKLDY